jgi:hypothetical protein
MASDWRSAVDAAEYMLTAAAIVISVPVDATHDGRVATVRSGFRSIAGMPAARTWVGLAPPVPAGTRTRGVVFFVESVGGSASEALNTALDMIEPARKGLASFLASHPGGRAALCLYGLSVDRAVGTFDLDARDVSRIHASGLGLLITYSRRARKQERDRDLGAAMRRAWQTGVCATPSYDYAHLDLIVASYRRDVRAAEGRTSQFDPCELTRLLRIQPTHVEVEIPGTQYSNSVWELMAHSREDIVEHYLKSLFEKIGPVSSQLAAYIRDNGLFGLVSWFVTSRAPSYNVLLSPRDISHLSACNLGLGRVSTSCFGADATNKRHAHLQEPSLDRGAVRFIPDPVMTSDVGQLSTVDSTYKFTYNTRNDRTCESTASGCAGTTHKYVYNWLNQMRQTSVATPQTTRGFDSSERPTSMIRNGPPCS